jgi:hypothetical protein
MCYVDAKNKNNNAEKKIMCRNVNLLSLYPVVCAALAIMPQVACADFVSDSKANLQLRNFFMSSDNRQPSAAQSRAQEWAQGFMLNYQSGFTEGPVGFGFDASGLLGLKLDSSVKRGGTGLLPIGERGVPDDYSRAGVTGKARISATTLRVGTLSPTLPTVLSTDSRLLPQTFEGVDLTSREIKGLTLNAGRLTQNTIRNSAGGDDFIPVARGSTGTQLSDEFRYAGGTYQLSKNLDVSYNYGNLKKNYNQQILSLVHRLPIAAGQSFKSDIRYARSTNEGHSNIDNQAFGAMFTYSLKGHGFGVGYQEMRGNTGFPYLNGTDAFLINYVLIGPDFANPEEKSWQLRYDFDFAALGIPGLSIMTRYIKGNGIQLKNVEGSEWERDTDIAYVIQSGRLKNLGVRWRNGTYRSDLNRSVDQNRIIVNYTIPLF